MSKFFKNKTSIIFIILFLYIVFFGFVFGFFDFGQKGEVVEAMKYDSVNKTGHNMSGFAWSQNIGWISFNSTDCDIDGDGAFEGNSEGGGSTPAPAGCSTSTVPFFDYGVKIDKTTGTTSGFAWSSNVGWIAFENVKVCSSDNSVICPKVNGDNYCATRGVGTCNWQNPPNRNFKSNCKNPTDCGDNQDCIACYKKSDQKIYGWAKVVSMGDKGWIKLQSDGSDPSPFGITILENKVTGWAWHGVDTDYAASLGWISFSSLDCDSRPPFGEMDAGVGIGFCTSTPGVLQSSYQVNAFMGVKPTITLSKLNIDPTVYCQESVRQAYLRWHFDDTPDSGEQTAYQLKLVTGGLEVFNTGKCTDACIAANTCPKCKTSPSVCGSAAYCQFPLGQSELALGKTYSWSVEVWDDDNMSSGVVPSASLDFSIPANEYPHPYFTVNPKTPSKDEDTLLKSFNLTSVCGVSSSACSFEWTENPGDIEFSSLTASSTRAKFKDDGARAFLKVVHTASTFSCSTSTQSIDLKKKLPKWIEAN